MAIYHFTAGKGQQGKHSAKAKSDYIHREGSYRKDVGELVTSGSGNMPEWATDHRIYWKAADDYERANGRLFRQYEFSLPKELTPERQEQLAIDFCREVATAKEGSLPYSYAIHHGKGENPHCHFMVSERVNDGYNRTPETWFKRANKKELNKGGAVKAESLEKKVRLLELREQWADMANIALQREGYETKIDHRSLEAQGIDRLATLHIGAHVLQMEEKGILTDKGQKSLEVLNENERRREIERGSCSEFTGVSRPDRTVSAEYGYFSGRPAKCNGTEQKRSYKYSPSAQYEDRTGSTDIGRDDKHSQNDIKQSVEGVTYSVCADERIRLETIFSNVYNSFSDRDNSTERICALAVPLLRERTASRFGESSGVHERELCEDGSRDKRIIQQNSEFRNNSKGLEESRIKEDRTTEAVKNQIRAMKCKTFEIGIRDQDTMEMMHRDMSENQVIASIPWLKRMNSQGNDIYIRPGREEQCSLILIDDIDGDKIEKMKARGVSPACVVQTSHKNLQAWISVGKKPMVESQRKDLAKLLAKEMEGDPASADAYHYGRLAGFTNRKPEHLQAGGFPYVLCKESTGREAEKSEEMRAWAEEREDAKKRAGMALDRAEAIKTAPRPSQYQYRVTAEARYKEYMAEWLERQEGNPDWSRGDYGVACRMLKQGYLEQEVADAMANHSPDIENRKGEHIEDYARRTVDAASRNPEVQKAVRQHDEEATREQEGHGLSM